MISVGGAEAGAGGKAPSLAERFVDMAQTAYVKAGRGGLDLAGLKGVDLKGFEGAPRDAAGHTLGGEQLQDAVSRSPAGGLGEVLGQGFEERAFQVARRQQMGRPERDLGRDGLGLGE